jgi:hypothetical protein
MSRADEKRCSTEPPGNNSELASLADDARTGTPCEGCDDPLERRTPVYSMHPLEHEFIPLKSPGILPL